MQKTDERFDSAACALPEELREHLYKIDADIKCKTSEIRLRAGKPLMLTAENNPLWITNGGVSHLPPTNPVTVTKEQLYSAFLALCENSVYSHEEELREGYISLKGGHRAGVCGTYISGGGIRDVSSVCIRIARQIFDCAEKVYQSFDGGGMIIAGPPGSGKTTLLRELVRLISLRQGKRIAVVDTRGEIAASFGGVPQNILGDTVDVLCGYPKPLGTEIAIRTLSPQIIAFDELGEDAETLAVVSALGAGVSVITTVHAGNERELFSRKRVKLLLSEGAVSKTVLLSDKIGEINKIFEDVSA